MGFFVDLFEVFSGDMGVGLGGDKISVTQHLLNGFEIAPPAKQVCGKRVTKGMGTDILPQRRLSNPSRHDKTRPTIRKAFSHGIKKERCTAWFIGRACF